jgi:hypothetical protein
METCSGNVETTVVEQGSGDLTGEGIAGIAVIIAVGLFGLWWSFHTPEPRYHAGQCVQLNDDAESWEPFTRARIEMIGKRKYLYRFIPENLYRDSEGRSRTFADFESIYIPITCPTKGAK